MNTLEQRIVRLERTNRRLCVALLVVSTLSGIGAAFPELTSPRFDTVRARALIIEDENENIRGIVGFRSENNENGIALIGRDGIRGFAITPGVAEVRVTKPDRSVAFIR